MPDGSIKIIIGAAMDRSVETVFGQIEKRAQRAAQNIGKSFSKGFTGETGGGPGKGFDSAVSAAKKAEREIEREIAKQVKATKSAAREMDREHKKSAQEWVNADRAASRDIIKNFKEITRERKKELDQQARDQKRMADAAKRESIGFGKNVGMYAVRNMSPFGNGPVGLGRRVAGDILRGAGVDFSVAGSVSRAVALESGSVQLANQERIATGSTIGSKKWNSISRGIAGNLSTDASGVQDMMLAMTAKTGEFKNASSIGGSLASLSVASGANLRDMGNAAGYVYNQLNKFSNAGEMTIEVMRAIVGQTAVGAVDMPDYAVQLGRIAANASKFEGSVADNIREQSALAQLAVESGGASSPADAARSVAAFSNTFGKHARIEAFAKHGVELFTVSNEEHRKDPSKPQDTLRKASAIIEDSFRKTKGDIPSLSIMFADTLGRKPVQALASSYKAASIKAGGGDAGVEAGVEAIKKSLGKYMNAQLSKEVEAQNIKDYQDSAAAKAIKFQNSLDMVVNTMAERVFPALEKLAPDALKAAQGLADIAIWAASNPKKAIGAAFGLAIAQAGIQATIRLGLEKGLEAVGPTMVTGLGKVLGGLAVMWPVIVAAAAAAAAKAAIENDIKDRVGDQKNRSFLDANAGIIEGKAAALTRRNVYTPDEKRDLEQINANVEERIKRAEGIKKYDQSNGGPPTSAWAIAKENLIAPEAGAARLDANHLEQLKAELESNKMILDMIRTGTLKVEVTNLPPTPGTDSRVDGNGRQPPVGNWVMR